MRIVVDSIVSERSFGIIFAGTADADGTKLRVRADLGRLLGVPAVGDVWQIDGDVRQTAYGPQIEVRGGHRLLSSGHLVRQFLAAHVPGIGPERAERLWLAFGENLPEILSTDDLVDDIALIIAPDKPILGQRLAVAVTAAWQAASNEAALVGWLDRHGVRDIGVARRINKVFGAAAMEAVAANPYVLVPLLPWRKVDDLGRRLLTGDGRSPQTDRRRLVGAADEAVKRMLHRGDTAASRAVFGRELDAVLGEGADIDRAMAAANVNGAVMVVGDLFRAPGAAALEDELVQRLRKLSSGGLGASATALSASGWSELLADAAPAGTALSADQSAAVAGVLGRPMSCLVGGAGTGKTFTCRMICDLWVRRCGDLLLCALAGKAALRLSRSTGRLARTLARTLAELKEREDIEEALADPDTTEEEARKARIKLEGLARMTDRTLVVIDEASMVDLPTVAALVRRLHPGSRLLMVGDPAQLAPIGWGLVFHELAKDPAVTLHLKQIHRQAAVTGIPVAAEAVRHGQVPDFSSFAGKSTGISFVDAGADELAQALDGVVVGLGGPADVLIVTATIGGAAGVDAVNERFHRRHVASGREEFRGAFGRRFAVGEPVIFGRNDYRAGLFNGLLGRVTGFDLENNAVEVLFDGDTEPKSIGGDHLPDLDLAYAVTCHKAQGSSARRVVVPVYASKLCDRSWIYTAITRAEDQVVLVGDRAVFGTSVAKPPAADQRKVGFRWP
jgi:exodeoxyribonuclease V alpha subunit